jgi:hypothetical protein
MIAVNRCLFHIRIRSGYFPTITKPDNPALCGRTPPRLRWHLHQLDPDLEHTTRRLPGPALDHITTMLARAAANASSLVQVRICQAQVAAIQTLTDQIGELDCQLRQRVARLAPSLARPGWLRAADRGQAHRRDRRRGPVPLRGLLCHARRGGTGPGQLRAH